MREILLSTQPKWCEKIGSGEKKAEVRKTRPKGQEPFKCFIYCTKADKKEQALLVDKNGRLSFGDYRNADNNDYYIANGKVIGEFVCNKVDEYKEFSTIKFNHMGLPEGLNKEYVFFEDDLKVMCLSYDEVKEYGKGKTLYGWHISNLVIYDKPKKLSDFNKLCPTKKEYDCENCERSEQYVCANYLTRPPQSWQYVLEK